MAAPLLVAKTQILELVLRDALGSILGKRH